MAVAAAVGFWFAAMAPVLADLSPDDLRETEQLLTRLGFSPGPVDGVIDSQTTAAIRAYQTFAALLPVDGEASEALLAELRGVADLLAVSKEEKGKAAAVPPSGEEPPAEPPSLELEAQEEASATGTAKAPSGPAVTTEAEYEPSVQPVGVQLASMQDPEGARRYWSRLQRELPSLLHGRTPTVVAVDLGDRGILYRLRTGPFPDRAIAANFCAEVVRTGQDCHVVSAFIAESPPLAPPKRLAMESAASAAAEEVQAAASTAGQVAAPPILETTAVPVESPSPVAEISEPEPAPEPSSAAAAVEPASPADTESEIEAALSPGRIAQEVALEPQPAASDQVAPASRESKQQPEEGARAAAEVPAAPEPKPAVAPTEPHLSSSAPATPESAAPSEAIQTARLSSPREPDTAESARLPQQTFGEGLSQADRRRIQRSLEALGLYRFGIDGRFGPGTRAAISEFQKIIGDTPTGYLSPARVDELHLRANRASAARVEAQRQPRQQTAALPPAAGDEAEQTGGTVPLSTGQPGLSRIERLTQVAEAGNPSAQAELGLRYLRGREVAKDPKEALIWSLKAAKQGNAEAQSNVGFMYITGSGTQKNQIEAARWWREAARQGLPQAQFNLGTLYENGHGVKRDYEQAAAWYRLSSAQGYGQAKDRLERLYLRGVARRPN